MASDTVLFSEIVATAFERKFRMYRKFLEEQGISPDQIERTRNILARSFVDGVAWALGGTISIAAQQLADLNQIEPVLEAYNELHTVLELFRDRSNVPGGDDAGSDDPRTGS